MDIKEGQILIWPLHYIKTKWVHTSLVDAAPTGGASLNGKSNGLRNMLQPGDGVKLRKEDACAGIKTTPAHAEPKKSNGSAAQTPGLGNSRPPSCILGMGTATPDRVFPMAEFAKTILHGFGENDTPEVREFSARICKSSGIMKKHMALGREIYHGDPNMQTYGAPSLDKRFNLFAPEAVKIGTLAAERAISNWGGDKSKITHLITYSTSGMTSPALDMQLIKVLGLAQTVKHFWVSLMGCHAGLIGIRTAAEIAQADPAYRVLVVCVEINSAQAQPLNPAKLLDLNNHVVSIIFGDGAAGVVIGSQPDEYETPIFEIHRSHTSYIPDTDYHITAKISQSGLLATLNKNVPVVVGQNCEKFVAQLLQGTELESDTVNWAVHPGGKAVVDAVEKACRLEPEQLRWTRYVLENYANMSSPTILFVLDKLRNEAQKLPAGSRHLIHPWTVVVGFGPGMTMEGILLKNC
ncbi:hypothetical protein KC19_9G063800 [Ceratodon purpureus]|uniref:Chalcone synthase n=1 Tax=Ceratodon purpureus TaxID=3225 RepID=A0A8T0GTD2_CERPU|nr:hypothetical protein KC19_9G063800 [Ceratodon purpureus]